MKRKWVDLTVLFMAISILCGCSVWQTSDPYGLEDKTHSAVVPVQQTDEWWMPRHERVLERVAEGNVDLIMIGDSITHGWEEDSEALWEQYYAPRNAVNMGFSGDRTQHVLWRLENGEIDGINPKLAVVMIGTNNSNGDDNTAEEIADGIKAICAKLRTELPKTKILILAIFPRGNEEEFEETEMVYTAMNDQWAKNNKASKLASKIADGKHIFYLDINDAFLNEKDQLTQEVMPDLLHPNKEGYRIWAEAMEPTIQELMGEK